MIKTFRGLLADGDQNRIRLSTKKGKIGYKIIKLQGFPETPGTTAYEHIVKIFKVTQSTVTGTVDLSDGNLLGVVYIEGDYQLSSSDKHTIIFDQEVFNQDIFITHSDVNGALRCNYYVELESMDLTDNAAAVSTLRDIRLNPQVGE